MFKWVCLAVASAFLAALAWMLNDLRVQARQTSQAALAAAKTVNDHLPEIVEKVRTTAEALAELSQDVRQLKELAGVAGSPRDKNLVAYADGLLDAIEASGGTIGLKKVVGSGLKSTSPAKEWAAAARKEALFLTVVAKSKKELLTRLAANKFGSAWQIQFGDGEPVPLLEWLKANHAASRDL